MVQVYFKRTEHSTLEVDLINFAKQLYTRARTHTHTRTHTHARKHTYTRARPHTYTHAYTHTRTHTHTHARTHAHTYTYARQYNINIYMHCIYARNHIYNIRYLHQNTAHSGERNNKNSNNFNLPRRCLLVYRRAYWPRCLPRWSRLAANPSRRRPFPPNTTVH